MKYEDIPEAQLEFLARLNGLAPDVMVELLLQLAAQNVAYDTTQPFFDKAIYMDLLDSWCPICRLRFDLGKIEQKLTDLRCHIGKHGFAECLKQILYLPKNDLVRITQILDIKTLGYVKISHPGTSFSKITNLKKALRKNK